MKNKRQILIIAGFIILLLAIPLTLYLVRQTQIFKPKAAFIPGVEFVDETGNVITETTDLNVKLRITSELASSPAPSAEELPSPSPSSAPVSARRVFITSTTYNGNLGGLAGGDQKCQTRADAAGLSGTWKAWLSDDNTSVSDRLTHNNDQYVRLDGQAIANNWDDLIDGSLIRPININESGVLLGDGFSVWTGTTAAGISSTDCSSWSSTSGSGRRGSYNATNSDWTYLGTTTCSVSLHLYCFEQSPSSPADALTI